MISQPSSSRTTLSSHADHQIVPHSIGTRRLLTRLDKSELISLTSRWLSSSAASHIPPVLSKRLPKSGESDTSSNLRLYHAILNLNEERRARSLEELRLLWESPMADPKVPKARAVDRIVDVDWPEGLSYGMIAELDLHYHASRRTSRTWVVLKLEYDDEADAAGKGYQRLTPQQIQTRFSNELSHYFEHHVYLHLTQHDGGKSQSQSPASASVTVIGSEWMQDFSYYRVVLAPSSSDVCGSGLHLLHLSRTPYVLISGGLGRGSENREMAMIAFAVSAGANTVNYPRPAVNSAAARRLGELDADGQDSTGNRRTLGELRGRDPVSLRDVLLHESGMLGPESDSAAAPEGVAGGGKARAMRSRRGIEDGPLVAPVKRRREDDVYALGVRLPTPPPSDSDAVSLSSSSVGAGRRRVRESMTPCSQSPSELHQATRDAVKASAESSREAEELFGPDPAKTTASEETAASLPKLERIEYEMHLPFPDMPAYSTDTLVDMSAYNSDPDRAKIKLRLEGTHVLAGLRKLVQSGMDRHTSYPSTTGANPSTTGANVDGSAISAELQGLPGWLSEVRGTRVKVVLPTPAPDSSDGSHDI
ncbi:CHL4-domain-containing protein [Testicularia cyperi]|uniref:CHL4-domain-containing protein n=1 Tax=Testicularia cyperi TaxID=1882483 RepID=A0A317XWJ4_9BASI|nr:CHL4-domain-containing protein [Testicularia cyperi]